jgi:FkbM family methyltransferase
MTVVLPDGISHFLYCTRFFEETSTRWLLQHLKPGQVFFDVGAHFGYFTLLAASIVRDTGSVHAFEPTPGSCRMLRENTASHRNVAIREAALWRQDCQLPFKDYGLRFSGLNSFTSPRISDSVRRREPRQPEDRQRDILVRAIRGDDYVEHAGVVPDLVKIDAEGAELAILEGLSRTLRKSHPLLIVEVEDEDSYGRVSSRQVVDLLSRLGYRVLEDPNQGHSTVAAAASQNVLFAPQSSNRTGGAPNRDPSEEDRS